MDYKGWTDLLGRTTEDKTLLEALAKVGVTKPLKVARDETDTRLDLDGMTLVFTHKELFPELGAGVKARNGAVFTGVILFLSGKWAKRELPFALKSGDSQKKLRARLGKPLETEKEFRWDEWEVKGRRLNVTFSGNFSAIESVFVSLPEPE